MAQSRLVYARPFPKEIGVRVCDDSHTHAGPTAHAIDFLMPDGSPVLASQDGVVIGVEDGHSRGGPSEEFDGDLNYLTIKHGCGEFSQVCHLARGSALVRPGQRVVQGQQIAYTGSTGQTYEPHLHFMVFRQTTENEMGFESLEVRFEE